MARITTNPRRDLDSPLVELKDDAPRAERIGATALRIYLPFVIGVAFLAGIGVVLMLLFAR